MTERIEQLRAEAQSAEALARLKQQIVAELAASGMDVTLA